jgi:hypothetical protein
MAANPSPITPSNTQQTAPLGQQSLMGYQQIQQQLSVDSHVALVIEFVFWLSPQPAQVHQPI